MDKLNLLSDMEKEIIDLRKNQIRDENSFYSKTFFTIVTIIVGLLYVFIKKPDFQLTVNWLALILFGVLLFYVQIWGMTSDLKRMYNDLLMVVINSQNLIDYKIKKSGWASKIYFGISVGYFVFVIILMVFRSFWWAIVSGILSAIISCFAPRHF